MALFHSYKKEGPGVEKSGLRPIRPLYFFQIFGRKIWKLCQLNILFVLLTIPIWITIASFILSNALLLNPSLVTVGELLFRIGTIFIIFSPLIGPATAGLTHLLKCFSTETPVFLYEEFFEQFKKNFKQSTFMTLIHGVLILSFALTLMQGNSPLFFGGENTLGVIMPVMLVINIEFIFMTYYAYTMMVTFQLKFSEILKNSFIFALAKLPLNLFILALVSGFTYLAYMKMTIGLGFSALILHAFSGLLVVFSIYPTIEKHMLIPAQKLEETQKNEEKEEI